MSEPVKDKIEDKIEDKIRDKAEDKVLEQFILITFTPDWDMDVKLSNITPTQLLATAEHLRVMGEFMLNATLTANYRRVSQEKAQNDALFAQIARDVKGKKS